MDHRVDRHRVLRRRVGEESGVRGEGEVDAALGLDGLHRDPGLACVLTGDGVDGRVPHHRGGHDRGLPGLLVREQHAAVGARFDLQALGPERQGVGEAGRGPGLDVDELFEARTGRLDHDVGAGHRVDVGRAGAVEQGCGQAAPPLEGDLLVALTEGDQVGGRCGPRREEGSRGRAGPARQGQTLRVGLGGDGTVRLRGEVDIHIAPGVRDRILEPDRSCGQLGGEGTVLVGPGGGGLGAFRECLDPSARQPRGDARGADVRRLGDGGPVGCGRRRERCGRRFGAVEEREGHGQGEASRYAAGSPFAPEASASRWRRPTRHHISSISSSNICVWVGCGEHGHVAALVPRAGAGPLRRVGGHQEGSGATHLGRAPRVRPRGARRAGTGWRSGCRRRRRRCCRS